MNQIEALIQTNAGEIYKAFSYYGPFEMSLYIMRSLSGSDELRDHDSFYLACLKLGDPDLSWEDALKKLQAAESASSMIRTNPQQTIFRPFQKKIDAAVEGFVKGTVEPANIPFASDHIYMNSILCTHEARSSEADLFGHTVKLMDHAFAVFDIAKGDLTVDQQLQLAGIVALACRCLPNHDAYKNPWRDNTVGDYLKIARQAVVDLKELDDLLPPLDALIARLKAYEHHKFFTKPSVFAIKVHQHRFEEKVRAVLQGAASLGLGHKPDALEM